MNTNTIYLTPAKARYLRSFFSSVIFFILSIQLYNLNESAVFFVIIAFFGLAAVASVIPLLPKQAYLKIDKSGLTVRSMFNTVKIAWIEVEQFYTRKQNAKDIVGFCLLEKKLTYLNIENFTGKKEVLPDTYGMAAGELKDLLEYFRIRYSY